MKKLQFVATGDKYNSYVAFLDGNRIDSCDINSKDMVTQAHIIIKNVQDTFPGEELEIVFDDSKAIHPRTHYTIDRLLNMSEYAHYTGMCRKYTLTN